MSLFTDEGALRSFCARILGWSIERAGAVEHAIRSIEFAVAHRVALMLLGETILVSLARALHRRMLGAEQPFGNVVGAARLLGMSHASLGEWLQRYRTRQASAPRRRPSPIPCPNATRGHSIRRPSR